VRDYEVHLRDVNGREFWVLLSAQPIRYAGVVGLLVALADIDVRKRMQEDMKRKAMHDQLTGLPNRAMFMESLERAVRKAKRRQGRSSVLFIDLDHFKQVNDTMGHAAGDRLLQAVAERLASAVRQSDLVARLAGDEFVVLIEDHKGPEEVMIVAQKVVGFLQRPVLLEWREVNISGSVGIASYPEDGDDVESLVKNADAAMYQAKERGRNNFQFYSADMNRMSLERASLELRVRDALERGEFFLEYQPEIELATGRLRAVEALLRWRDPTSSDIVMPPDFLPFAEENGTIIPIGQWVLDRVLEDAKGWAEAGIELTISINLSARQLQQQDLVEAVAAALRTHGQPAHCLRFEIPEMALMGDSEGLHRTVRGLQRLGVEVAIDNFGSGYSSLGLVRGFSVTAVKIDKTLVSSCINKRECAAIVEAVGTMAKTLGITVIAAGVETEEEKRLVQSLGCERAQGMLVGRPAGWSEIREAKRSPSLLPQ
jgi:diguanylate cyclase (GGDEF)-like protein